MVRTGRYTFATEEERAADYRARVGPLRRPRTNTIDRPEDLTLAQWLKYLKDYKLARNKGAGVNNFSY
jgi:hypothetical protein